MTDKEKIKRMYSHISAPDSAIEKCLQIEKTKVVRFPIKRVLVIAACIVLLIAAIAIPVYAVKHYNAYNELQNYSSTLPYQDKVGDNYEQIHSNSSLIQGNNMKASSNGLTITAQEAYYDGKIIYISFFGDYVGDLDSIERFTYKFESNNSSFFVDGKKVIPNNAPEFFMIKTENCYSGVLGLPYDSDKNEVVVEIMLPYLDAITDGKIIGQIQGDFNFKLSIPKSYDDVLTYYGELDENNICIHSIVSAPSGLEIVFYVPDSLENNGVNIIPIIKTEGDDKIVFVDGSRKSFKNGVLHTMHYSAIDSEIISIDFCDKNNVDGCDKERCILASYSNIILS